MEQLADIKSLRAFTAGLRAAGKRIGFVPTMGNLHDGHLSLVDEAFRHSDEVLVSIFVNPMQFDRADDLANYPRTLEQDMTLLRELGVCGVFTPTPDLLYPEGLDAMSRVTVPGLADVLEGSSRPGHFTGVSTVVTKLFNLVQSDVAVFGEKDFQQLAIIRKMVRDLDMPVDVLSLPTVRDDDGLAMSSRNGYLTVDERAIAPHLYRILNETRDAIVAGDRDYQALEVSAAEAINDAGFKTDYVRICNGDTLVSAEPDDAYVVILASAWLGKARLIDNIAFRI